MARGKIVSKLYIGLVYALFFLIALIILRAAYAGMSSEELSLSDGRYYMLLDVVLMLNIFISFVHLRHTPRLIYVVFIWTLFQLLQLVISGYDITFIFRLLSWPIMFIALYYYALSTDTKFALKIFFWGLVLLSAFSVYNEMHVRQLIDIGGLNEVYWVLLGLPFAYCMSDKKLKYIAIIVIAYVVLLSMKSTAFLAIVIAILAGWAVEGEMKSKSLVIMTVTMVVFFILWPMISDYLASTFNVVWIDKYNESVETGGSGRLEIWSKTLSAIAGSSFKEFFFGHGHNSVYKAIGFSAHNDFLEVMYDYGIIAFSLYILFYYYLVATLNRMLKTNFRLKAAFAVSLTLFFTVSFLSHLMIYPGLMLHLAAFWGLSVGCFVKQRYFNNAIHS